jgi:hypothetical protein
MTAARARTTAPVSTASASSASVSAGELDLAEDDHPAPTVVADVWLRRSTPSPTRWRRGTAALGPGSVHWRPRHRAAELAARAIDLQRVDLTRVRGTTAREVLRVDRSCTVFGLATDNELLELAVLPADLPVVRAVLRSCRSSDGN